MKKYIFIVLFFITVASTMTAQVFTYSSNSDGDFTLSGQIKGQTGAAIYLQDQTNSQLVKVEIGEAAFPLYHLRLKKQLNLFLVKIWPLNQNEPNEWMTARVIRSIPMDPGLTFSELENVNLVPANSTSINTSWGRIKYLFNN